MVFLRGHGPGCAQSPWDNSGFMRLAFLFPALSVRLPASEVITPSWKDPRTAGWLLFLTTSWGINRCAADQLSAGLFAGTILEVSVCGLL